MSNQLKSLVAAAVLVFAGTAQAALIDRGGGMIYDDVLKITWLSDWLYAKTQYEDTAGAQGAENGRMDRAAANGWARDLVYGGYSGWRLPTSLNIDGSGPCDGFNCAGSEMGHMFYNNWGATARDTFSSGTNTANLALFRNVQPSSYWSSTEYAERPDFSWIFRTDFGEQDYDFGFNQWYVVAVHPGDVAAPIPEPSTYALMLAGLAAVGFAARRRRALQRGLARLRRAPVRQ